MTLNWDNVTAITHNLIMPTIKDNVSKSNPVLMKLYQKGQKLQGGVKILQPVEYDTGVANSYSGYDTFSVVPKEIITDAEYEWKDNYATITISGDDERKNSGAMAVHNLLTTKTNNARKTLENNMGYQLFSFGSSADGSGYGRGVKGITGLLSAVDSGDTVATYGGINRGDYSWWAARETNWASTPVSEYAFQVEVGALTDGTDSPDMAVCAQGVFDKFFSVLVDKQRFASTEMARAGFKSLMLSYDVPLVVDTRCPSTIMFILNTEHLDLVTHQDANFKFFPFASAVDQPDVKTASIIWSGNLTSSKCKMQGQVYGINPTL